MPASRHGRHDACRYKRATAYIIPQTATAQPTKSMATLATPKAKSLRHLWARTSLMKIQTQLPETVASNSPISTASKAPVTFDLFHYAGTQALVVSNNRD